MPTPQEVIDLIERFERNRESYRSSEYNEAQVRLELINPFFKALGWDIYNEESNAEAYKDVVHEATIKVGGATKAPDYAFRIGGVQKFFVEAKRPGVDIKNNPEPAYQLRRYAWSAKLPLSILTDFEEFAVYDGRIRPNRADKASAARILYITYTEYETRWEEIAAIFSREAILKGSFDKYVESSKRKRGTAEVDDAFLKEIENWRDLFARNIALRNSDLSTRELNYAVQRTVDRIIFLRICEDRGIEDYGQLRGLQNGTRAYERLCQIFRRADERYNSGLFHFSAEKQRPDPPDDLTLNLTIDDKVLKEIFKGLYYPESPFEFSVLPADILGHIYEQFLGKVIRLTPGHRAKVEDKPEVKKAGGVYYTPTYIVDYIVKNTVGKLLEGNTPTKVAKIRVLDPACGSGSFLLGAYQHLLDWHQEWYAKHDPQKHAKGRSPKVYRTICPSPHGRGRGEGAWRLTTAEKKRILLNNIYGVDIDTQAVEVTKLSLLLKVLEGENAETLGKSLRLFHERALPDLGKNIKCGNSLIGPDFYEGKQLSLLDDEERYRINAFDWESEFPEVFAPSPAGRGQGEGSGFDAVIGNPPYIRIQAMKEWAPIEVEFYKRCYQAASKGNYDIYVVFVERVLQLLNEHGRMGFIMPHKFFQAKYGEALRKLISEGNHLSEVVHFGDQQVFAGASTYTCLLFLDKGGSKHFHYINAHDLNAWRTNGKAIEGEIPADKVTEKEWNFVVGPGVGLFERLGKMPVKLADVVTGMFVGQQTSADTIFLFKEYQREVGNAVDVWSKELDRWIKIERDVLKPVVRSGNINRYSANPTALVLFPYEVKNCRARLYTPAEMQDQYPLAWTYLKQNKRLLEDREKGKFKDHHWYRFGRSQNLGAWEQPKLMIPYMITDLAAYYDQSDNFYFINVTTGGYGITVEETTIRYPYLCGLLNSRLLDFYLKRVSTSFRGGYLAANRQFIEQLPIRAIDFSDPTDKAHHDGMVDLVETMLKLHKDLQAAKTNHEKSLIQRQIDATDKQIDQLVYELYGLTEKEIRIVEEAAK